MGNRLNIFISYRRDDSTDFAGRLHDNLMQEYDNVFLDTEDGIPAGKKFLTVIVNEIEKADVFLMLVGKESAKNFEKKKAEGNEDYVLKEIVHAQKSSCTIIPVLAHEVNGIAYLPKEITFIKELSYYAFAHPKFSLNFKGLVQEIEKCRPKVKEEINRAFTQEVMNEVLNEKLLVLFSQDFTDISKHYESIKTAVKSKFSDEFYMVSIPSFVDEAEEYFACVATDCGISCEVKKVSDWNRAMQEKLSASSKPLLLFVTDLENGNEIFDKQFATILRSLKSKFPHFHAILVGRKELATLVYGEGTLSPLNNAKELFFPEQETKLGSNKITQQFNSMGKYKTQVCKLLKKEKVARFAAWSHDETINSLFHNIFLTCSNHALQLSDFFLQRNIDEIS